MLYFGRSPWLTAQVYALRRTVFVEEQQIPAALEFDRLDQTCPYYLWLGDNDQPIATVRYQLSDPMTV
ncbi:GNAT family N-acetyltransferase [Enterococcus sp. N342-3-1-2]